MSLLQSIIAFFIVPVLSIIFWLIIIQVIMSWLVMLNVINLRNGTVRQIYYGIESLTRPLMAPIQRVLPSFGGFDFSPIVILLLIQWLQWFFGSYIFPMVG